MRERWPFRSCATPTEFVQALREDLPHRYTSWNASWWIDDLGTRVDNPDLVVSLNGLRPRISAKNKGHSNNTLSPGDLLGEVWHREEASDPAVRSFPRYKHLHLSCGGYEFIDFRVRLEYLPKIQKLHALLQKRERELGALLRGDTEMLRLQEQIHVLRQEEDTRREVIVEKFNTKHAKELEAFATLRKV